MESMKKWVLKPHFGLESRVKRPGFFGLASGSPIRRADLAPGFLCSPLILCLSLVYREILPPAALPFFSLSAFKEGVNPSL